jgi:hypothetical protein
MQPAFPPLDHAGTPVDEVEKLAAEYTDEPSIYGTSKLNYRKKSADDNMEVYLLQFGAVAANAAASDAFLPILPTTCMYTNRSLNKILVYLQESERYKRNEKMALTSQ